MSLTGSDIDQRGSGVDNAGSSFEDGCRFTVPNRLINAPEFACRISLRNGTVQSKMKTEHSQR
jgi:hypothetical protein